MNRKNVNIAFFVLGAFLVIFLIWGSKTKSVDGELSGPVGRGPVIESVYGIGTVTANRTFQFKTGVISTLEKLFVKEGDAVKQGDALVMLENDVVIKAPFDGTVTALPFKAGENIFTQMLVVEVVDLLDRYLVVSLEQRGALRVRKGQKARLSFDGLREESFEGTVDSVYSSAGDFLIRVDISRLPPQILPGMTADVAIGINERANVLLVPVAALVNGHVYIKRNGSKEKVAIQTGIIDGVMAEVVAGDIREGDRLFIPEKVRP